MRAGRRRRPGAAAGLASAAAAVLLGVSTASALALPAADVPARTDLVAPGGPERRVAASIERLGSRMTEQIAALEQRAKAQEANVARLAAEREQVLATLQELHGRMDAVTHTLEDTVFRLKLVVGVLVFLCAIVFAWILVLYRRLALVLGPPEAPAARLDRPSAVALEPGAVAAGD